MTKQEARKIKDLQIHPTPLVEDCFYLKMAIDGKISEEKGLNALNRIKDCYDDAAIRRSLLMAGVMIENLKKYGVACIDWM